MSYSTHVRVIQTKARARFSIVEKTVWHYANGGTWSEVDGEHTLTMGGSGTSGTLRFKNSADDYCLVALGVHNHRKWFDIVVDLKASNTGVEIHPTFYAGGSRASTVTYTTALEKSTSKGSNVKVEYYKEEGTTHWVTITFS